MQIILRYTVYAYSGIFRQVYRNVDKNEKNHSCPTKFNLTSPIAIAYPTQLHSYRSHVQQSH